MKQSMKCPKCGSTRILMQDHGCIQPRKFVEVGIFRAIGVTRYICTECGYMEEWIDPPSQLKELVEDKRKH